MTTAAGGGHHEAMRSRFLPGWLLCTGVVLAVGCGGASMLETGGTSTSTGSAGGAGGGLAPGKCTFPMKVAVLYVRLV